MPMNELMIWMSDWITDEMRRMPATAQIYGIEGKVKYCYLLVSYSVSDVWFIVRYT